MAYHALAILAKNAGNGTLRIIQTVHKLSSVCPSDQTRLQKQESAMMHASKNWAAALVGFRKQATKP